MSPTTPWSRPAPSPAANALSDGPAPGGGPGSTTAALRAERASCARSPLPQPVTPRAFSCRCGRPVFFRNSVCLACHTPLGYEPTRRLLLPLEPAPASAAGTTAAATESSGLWRQAGASRSAPRYRRCGNLDTAASCNWLVPEAEAPAGQPTLCRCCRLTRTLPDLSVPGNSEYWYRIELAKRRLVSSLIALRLPLQSKSEDPGHGLVLDLLRGPPGGPPVITGHDDGVITLDVEEADDAHREESRDKLGERYRTLLGHLRHEIGHYYWQRLVDGSEWQEPCRAVFGDERLDYAAALKKHYAEGPPVDWNQRHVSAYASSHPWEDWAETWAHYLHMVDTLDTALSFGLEGERVELQYERFSPATLAVEGTRAAIDEEGRDFLRLLNGWMELTGVLNELSRSMGVPDFYPFVLSAPAVRKLHFVHRVVVAARR